MTQPNQPATGSPIPPQPKTKLVTSPTVAMEPTGVQMTDSRLALTRGLAEYVSTLEFQAPGGRLVRFEASHEEWAEPEEHALYPSSVITLLGPGQYVARGLTPSVMPDCRLPEPDGRYLVVVADYQQDMQIQVWANDPLERSYLSAMLERALNPVSWRYGFVLELPHYFNQRATFALKDVTYDDSEAPAKQRYRVALFTVTGVVPVTMLYEFPTMKPKFDLAALGPDVDVTDGNPNIVVVNTYAS